MSRARRTGQSPFEVEGQTQRVAGGASGHASARALQVFVPAATKRRNGTTFATLDDSLVRFHRGHTVDIRLAIEHGPRLLDCM